MKNEEYDDLLPVSLFKDARERYWIVDKHNDEVAEFSGSMEIEDMERIVALINRKENNNAVISNAL